MNITLSFLLCGLSPFFMKSHIVLYFVISMLRLLQWLLLAFRITIEPGDIYCWVTNYHQIQRLDTIIHICDLTQLLWVRNLGVAWLIHFGISQEAAASTLARATVMCRHNWKSSSEMVSSNGWQIGSSSCLELSTELQCVFFNFLFSKSINKRGREISKLASI